MKHGGKRKGAGRCKAPHGPSKIMRIPLGCAEQVKKFVIKYKKLCLKMNGEKK